MEMKGGTILEAAAAYAGFSAKPDCYSVLTDIQAWGGGATNSISFNLDLGPAHPSRHLMIGIVNHSNSTITSYGLNSPDPNIDPADLSQVSRYNTPALNIRWFNAYFPQGDQASLDLLFGSAQESCGVVAYAIINRDEYPVRAYESNSSSVPGVSQVVVPVPGGGAVISLAHFNTSSGSYISTGCQMAPHFIPAWAVSGSVDDDSSSSMGMSGVGSVHQLTIGGAKSPRTNVMTVVSVK